MSVQEIFKTILNLIPTVLNTLFIYFFIIFSLRLAGRRQTSEISIVELIIVAIMGSAVETAMVAGNKSLLAGLVASSTLLLGNRLLSFLMQRWNWLRKFLVGRPVPLVYKGQILTKKMREAGLDEDDIYQGLREKGYEDLKKVQLAMLEIDGEISVLAEEKEGKKG